MLNICTTRCLLPAALLALYDFSISILRSGLDFLENFEIFGSRAASGDGLFLDFLDFGFVDGSFVEEATSCLVVGPKRDLHECGILDGWLGIFRGLQRVSLWL